MANTVEQIPVEFLLGGNISPTSFLSEAEKGTLYIWFGSTGGTLWQKQDSINSSNWTMFESASGAGTVTSVTAGTGLTASPNPITSSGTISLANTAVTPGSYTRANITVNAQGQVTAASSSSINSFPARLTTGAVTVSAATDYIILLNDTSGGLLNINLPAGTAGLSFRFSMTGAANAASTTYTFVPNGGDTLDSAVPSPFHGSLELTWVSGTWYIS